MTKVYRLGAAVFDPALAHVECDGRVVELQPKLLEVLLLLLRHRDRVVTKRELLAAVWPGVAVSESSLTRVVSLLRTALGESAAEPRVIRTVSRHGYRVVDVVELERPDPAPDAAPRPADPFVGRDADLAALEAAWAEARAGRGRVVLLSGEAGIGKTRLADELRARAQAQGARAVLGFSPAQGGAPPLWPWSRALRAWGEQEGLGALDALARAVRVDLALLLPEHAGWAPSAQRGDAAPARFEALDQLERLVAALAARRPLVLVLDDLHAADRSSLRALELVARSAAASPLLLVAIYREGELAPADPLHALIAALERDPELVRIRLAPLARGAADRLIEELARAPIPPDVSRAIQTRAAGNPLFLRELVRAYVQEPALPFEAGALPPAVSELIRGRIERRPTETRRALLAAAVIGADFELELLRRVADLAGPPLSAAIDDMVRSGWVRLVARGPTRYGFVHPLVQETLRASARTEEQAELHARAAAALAEEHAGRIGAVAERLAEHHFAMAIAGHADASPAEYARLAAEGAERRLAFDEAARWFERAQEALEIGPRRDDAFRAEVLIGLARTRWTLGDHAGAITPAERAADLARCAGREDLVARAALVSWARAAPHGPHVARGLALLEAAERGLHGTPDPVRAEVLARTAEHLARDGAHAARVAELCEEALALARTTGRPDTLYSVLYCSLFATWARHSHAERCALSGKLMELARGMNDPVAAIQASPLHLTALIEEGDAAAADAEISHFEREIANLEVPAFFRWYGPLYRATRALMRGRFDDGERLALESFGHARRANLYDAPRALGAQLFLVGAARGRHEQIVSAVRESVASYPEDPSYPAFYAQVLAETGRTEKAQSILAQIVDVYDPALDQNRGITAAILAAVCEQVGDAERAAHLYDVFAPEAELIAVNLSAWICLGSIHQSLGKLARARGDATAARRHFVAAARRNAEASAAAFVPSTRCDHASLLLACGELGEARELAQAALESALRLGVEPVRTRAEELLRRLA
ncbi:MAG TPA: AAA family ATPase [Myxococcota bacterium]|nr:AAA family ATPase [Myxococcota bacterium]